MSPDDRVRERLHEIEWLDSYIDDQLRILRSLDPYCSRDHRMRAKDALISAISSRFEQFDTIYLLRKETKGAKSKLVSTDLVRTSSKTDEPKELNFPPLISDIDENFVTLSGD